MEFTLQQDDFLPLRNVVFNTLRDAILRGEMTPGERLMEIPLAHKLGVSRTPVREAIRMLENEGLAVTYPRRGAQVAKMSEKDLDDVLEIREVLDTLAVSLACDNMGEEDFDRLQQAVDEFVAATKGNDIRLIVKKDEEFHNVIYECSNNPRLRTILTNLKEQMYRFRFEYVKDPSTYPTLINEHREILDALRARDKSKVVELTSTHLVNQTESVREIILKQE
ncbi:MAG: GntR family transcriptional regulator [Lachnospiraceae bacterium]|nr:GntR family transcriptional regulator [Lachnospiraceae bacterium]